MLDSCQLFPRNTLILGLLPPSHAILLLNRRQHTVIHQTKVANMYRLSQTQLQTQIQTQLETQLEKQIRTQIIIIT